MAIGDGWGITVRYAVLGQTMSSTWHYIVTEDLLGGEVGLEMATNWWGVNGDNLAAISGDNTTFESVYSRILMPLGTENPGYAVLGGQRGNAGPNCPTTTAAIFLVTSPLIGSQHNNRVYWGAVGQDLVDGNQITAAGKAGAFQTLEDSLRTGVAAGAGQLQLAAKVQPPFTPPDPKPPLQFGESPFVTWRPTLKNNNNRRSKLSGLHTPPLVRP